MSFHREVLNGAQLQVFPALACLADIESFYLGGGTAMALQLGHRQSVDFDWFSSSTLKDPLALARRAEERGLNLEDIQVAPGTLHATVNGVRVSILEYLYPQLSEHVVWPEYSCSFASLDDLGAMKLAAVAQRGSRKDFVDIYALGDKHKPLLDLLELYRRKYSVQDIGHVLAGLAYFDDAEDEPMPTMLWDVSWHAIRSRISDWTKAIGE